MSKYGGYMKLSSISRNILCAALLICGAVLFSVGAGRGEMQVVLTKAVNLCLQCIGIG